jgi:hypothetical protein
MTLSIGEVATIREPRGGRSGMGEVGEHEVRRVIGERLARFWKRRWEPVRQSWKDGEAAYEWSLRALWVLPSRSTGCLRPGRGRRLSFRMRSYKNSSWV